MISKEINKTQRIFKRIYSHSMTSESVILGILLAIVGGILETYTFMGRGGVFCNAQTGNIALLGIEAAKGEWRQALIYVPPIFAFIVGVLVAEVIKKTSPLPYIRDSERAVLILEIVILFIIGFIPNSVPNIFVTVTISFVASVQVSSFRMLVDSPYATTMLTGNLRSASLAAYTALAKKDSEAAARAIRYLTIIVSFLLGAFFGGVLILSIGTKAIWGAVLVLIFALILFNIDEHQRTKTERC